MRSPRSASGIVSERPIVTSIGVVLSIAENVSPARSRVRGGSRLTEDVEVIARERDEHVHEAHDPRDARGRHLKSLPLQVVQHGEERQQQDNVEQPDKPGTQRVSARSTAKQQDTYPSMSCMSTRSSFLTLTLRKTT